MKEYVTEKQVHQNSNDTSILYQGDGKANCNFDTATKLFSFAGRKEYRKYENFVDHSEVNVSLEVALMVWNGAICGGYYRRDDEVVAS